MAVCQWNRRCRVLGVPVRTDPEVAAIKLAYDLELLWSTGRPTGMGWVQHASATLGPLYTVVQLPAKRSDGGIDDYYVKIGAEYYDSFPPTVAFVQPETWVQAGPGSKWLPTIGAVPWFGLHPNYNFPGEAAPRQLVCFTSTAEYYMVGHSPPESTVWQQGKHTVAATLYRLAEVLQPPYYLGRAGQ
jgi:hypothetical protein